MGSSSFIASIYFVDAFIVRLVSFLENIFCSLLLPVSVFIKSDNLDVSLLCKKLFDFGDKAVDILRKIPVIISVLCLLNMEAVDI